jgi:dTMP kinase
MIIGLTAAAAILAGFTAITHWFLSLNVPAIHAIFDPLAPALFGPRAGVIIDSFTFLFSAIMVIGIKVAAAPPRRKDKLSMSLIGADVVESLKFLGGQRELRGLILGMGLAILGGGAVIPVGTNYVEQNLTGTLPFASRFHQLQTLTASPTTFMLVFMAFGMVFGALIVPKVEQRVAIAPFFGGSVLAFGLALLGFASVQHYLPAALFGVVAGACVAMVSVAANAYVVRTTADELRGRVFTAMESVTRLALLASMIIMAPIADIIGTYVYNFAISHGMAEQSVYWTGSRITLQLASLIVIGASFYAFAVLSPPKPTPAEQPAEEPLRA